MKQAGVKCGTAMIKMALALTACLVLFGSMYRDVNAEEGAVSTEAVISEEKSIIQASLMVTATQALGLETPSADAAVVVEFPAGTQIMVTGQQDGWYEAFYQGKTIYVAENELTASTAIDQTALDEEFRSADEKNASYIESLEVQRKAINRSNIWRGIIVVLIVAVFAIGIVSTLKKNENKDDKKKRKRKGSKR